MPSLRKAPNLDLFRFERIQISKFKTIDVLQISRCSAVWFMMYDVWFLVCHQFWVLVDTCHRFVLKRQNCASTSKGSYFQQGRTVNTSEIKTNDDNSFMWEVRIHDYEEDGGTPFQQAYKYFQTIESFMVKSCCFLRSIKWSILQLLI